MGYYAGGYYAGGYYAGGLFGNLFTGVKKIAGGAIKGLIKGGPLGAVTGAAGGAISAVGTNIQKETLAAGGTGSALTPELMMKHAAALARGGGAAGAAKPGTAIMLAPGGGMMMVPMAAGMLPKGYRLNKSTYATRGGGTSRWPMMLELHPKHTELVRNRRMNWGNSRALVRAEHRIGSFLRHATRYIKWAHPGKKGRAFPKLLSKRRKR
jgi:hypothetical protein